MNKFILAILVVVSLWDITSARVHPQSKLYFSFPIGPAPTTAAPTTQAATTTAAAATTTAATTNTQTQLNVIPLGQLLGMILTGLFGTTLPSQQGGASGGQLNVVPLFQALGSLFG